MGYKTEQIQLRDLRFPFGEYFLFVLLVLNERRDD